MRFALIQNGIVATVVEQDDVPTIEGTWVDVTSRPSVGSGFTYDAQTDTFTSPPVLIAMDPRDFWRRFLVAEREALQDMMDNGTLAQKKKLKAFKDYVAIGGNIELFDDYIIASVNAMETAGVLAAGRAAKILGG